MKVLFDDQPVSNLNTLSANIRNSGNDAIEEQDYWDPVTINLGEGIRVLNAEVSRTEPPGISASVELADSSKVVLKPVPLNGGDVVSLGIVLTGSTDFEAITVDGRIKGVKTISKTSGMRQASSVVRWAGPTIVVFVTAISIFGVQDWLGGQYSGALDRIWILFFVPAIIGALGALFARVFEAREER